MPGDNNNAGTSPGAPKRTLAGFNVNTLPAGTQLRFARGGAWTDFRVQVRNLNATPTAPIVFDSYAPAWGGSTPPWLKVAAATVGFEFGQFEDTENDGGYTVRNFKIDGEGVARWAVWLRTATRYVTLENLELTGFEVALRSSHDEAPGNTQFVLRNSVVHHNTEMGWLGGMSDSLLENNTFESNNVSGSTLNHALYLSSGSLESRNVTLRGNRFVRNSVVNGRCTGGNVTLHGRVDGFVFENNTIEQDGSDGGCYGLSISPSYGTSEWFRNVVVRANTIVNLGNCAVCAAAAPGIVVENNLVVSTQAAYHAAFMLPAFRLGAGDDADGGAVVRNNTIVLTQAGEGNEAISLRAAAGSGLRMVSNLVYYGAGSHFTAACFADDVTLSNFLALDYNLCHHASGLGRWSRIYTTLVLARAAGADLNGLAGDPLFVSLPTASVWNDALQAASPALDAGHPTQSSARDRIGIARTVPAMGSRE